MALGKLCSAIVVRVPGTSEPAAEWRAASKRRHAIGFEFAGLWKGSDVIPEFHLELSLSNSIPPRFVGRDLAAALNIEDRVSESQLVGAFWDYAKVNRLLQKDGNFKLDKTLKGLLKTEQIPLEALHKMLRDSTAPAPHFILKARTGGPATGFSLSVPQRASSAVLKDPAWVAGARAVVDSAIQNNLAAAQAAGRLGRLYSSLADDPLGTLRSHLRSRIDGDTLSVLPRPLERLNAAPTTTAPPVAGIPPAATRAMFRYLRDHVLEKADG